jgi:hypothetical protein
MFKQITRLAAGAGVVASAALMFAVSSGPPAVADSDFGEHISTCAQTTGFSADHNPGMHQGFHAWDPTHSC